MPEFSSLSTQYIEVPVTFTVGGVLTDPTADRVQLAFVTPSTDPVPGDWVTGSWASDLRVPNRPKRWAGALVGPGGVIALAKGWYAVWVKLTDNPELPAQIAGTVQIT